VLFGVGAGNASYERAARRIAGLDRLLDGLVAEIKPQIALRRLSSGPWHA